MTECKVMLSVNNLSNIMGHLNEFYNKNNGLELEEKYRYCNINIKDLNIYKYF